MLGTIVVEMETIMKLQDGLTKSDAVAIIDDQNTVMEIVEMKEVMKEVTKLEGLDLYFLFKFKNNVK